MTLPVILINIQRGKTDNRIPLILELECLLDAVAGREWLVGRGDREERRVPVGVEDQVEDCLRRFQRAIPVVRADLCPDQRPIRLIVQDMTVVLPLAYMAYLIYRAPR